ncbi:MAG: protein kinase domain-containing protein [Gemmataceae bacterium]
MPLSGSAELVRELQKHGLLDAECLDQITRHLAPRCVDAKQLARELMQRGWLTAFQLNHIMNGRGAELVLGSYILLERLGEGGMGSVYKARHQNLDRIVAIKVVRKELVANPVAVRRFQREVRAAAKLSHPNVVRAFDANEINGTHFLVMEYVDGVNLSQLIKDNGPLPIRQCCEIIRQVAQGLQHAHEHNIIHRDIKPHNLLITSGQSAPASPTPAEKNSSLHLGRCPRPVVKILDMGLVRVQKQVEEDNTSLMTQEGTIMGTPDYIAPEQARQSDSVDIRADLYSLGCTFYYLLTGRVPFTGTLTEKLLKHQLDDPEPITNFRSGVPAGVSAVVQKLMAKKPEDRFQTPAELVAHLSKGLDGPSAPQTNHAPESSSQIPLAMPVAANTPSGSTENHTFPGRSRARRPARSWWRGKPMWLALSSLFVVGLLLGVWQLLFSGPPLEPPAPAPPPVARSDDAPWPGSKPGLILAWAAEHRARQARGPGPFGTQVWSLQPRNNANWDRDGHLRIRNGAFVIEGAGNTLLKACQQTNQLSLELVLFSFTNEQYGPARILTFSSSSSARNFTLGQEGDQLILRLKTTDAQEDYTELPLARIPLKKFVHLLISYREGELVCYLNGKSVKLPGRITGTFQNWEQHQLLLGDEWDGKREWDGFIERFALYNRFIGANEAERHFQQVAKILNISPNTEIIELEDTDT